MRVAGVVAILSILACSAQAPESVEADGVTGPFAWGATQVTRAGNLYFAGQPDEETFEVARDRGVGVVVNLRLPGEHYWNEVSTVEGLGMAYYNVPVASGEPFSREAFAEIERIVGEHGDEPILVHCRSGERVAAWYATHLVETQGLEQGEALAVARAAGLRRDATALAVAEYLERSAPEPVAAPAATEPLDAGEPPLPQPTR